MVKDIDDVIKENEKLVREKNELHHKLIEANEVIEAIKKGNIDAVFTADNEVAKVLVSGTYDQAYRKFIENMSEGVVTLHTEGTIIYSNSSFADMMDMPLEKVIGANFRNFIPAEYIEYFDQYLTGYPKSNSKLELSIQNRQGVRTHFIVSLNTLQLQDFGAVNLVWTDVTVQKKAEEKLVAVNEDLKKAIEARTDSEKEIVALNDTLKENIKILEAANIELATFAHIASHDLQEPLRKIITYSSLLIAEYHDKIDDRGKSYIDNMQRASTRMRKLINDILEYSQLSEEQYIFESTSLQAVVLEVFSNLEVAINETKAKISIEKELPTIEANFTQMRQLFQNLISNALKFVKAGTEPDINITYEVVLAKDIRELDKQLSNEKFCIIYIKDNGIGFKEEYIDRIFTIFQKLNNNTTYQGTGIGLAICKKIVEKHRGFIAAESKPNDGSLFTITLPVSQPAHKLMG